MQYRKKPVVIEAIQFTEDPMSGSKIVEWSDHKVMHLTDDNIPCLIIDTLEGKMRGGINDFIIKGVNGEFYPCKPDIFEKTYDKVENGTTE